MVRRGPCRRPVNAFGRALSVRRAAPIALSPGGESPAVGFRGRASFFVARVSHARGRSFYGHDQDAAGIAPRLDTTSKRGFRPEPAPARAGLAVSGAVAPP